MSMLNTCVRDVSFFFFFDWKLGEIVSITKLTARVLPKLNLFHGCGGMSLELPLYH